MSQSVAIGMLRQGNTGEQILQILDAIVSGIEQDNIEECAAHYAAISNAAISMPTLDEVEF